MNFAPEEEIWFYEGIFSNFYQSPIGFGGEIYPTSEAYYQSQKFTGKDASITSREYAKIIASQNTGNKAAVLARQKKPQLTYQWGRDLWKMIQEYQSLGVEMRSDWDEIKDNVMRRAVYQKFVQNPKLKKSLIETGNKLMFEHTHRDSYWADGHPFNNPKVHGTGKNMLGIILEETRYILGGELSTRDVYTKRLTSWVIPGTLLVSGVPTRKEYLKFRKNGFQYIVSLMTYEEEQSCNINYRGEKFEDPKIDFCRADGNVVVARWGIGDRDKKAINIAMTLIKAIGHGYPVVLHCFDGKCRAETITCIVLGLLYGLDGEESIEVAGSLFDRYRVKKASQTKEQVAQIRRILNKDVNKRKYKEFDF